MTDHKPLLPRLMTHCLDQLLPRIQRFRMCLLRFNIESMIHVTGKEMYTSDTLSRLMARKSVSNDVNKFNEETEAYVCSILDSLPVSDVKLQKIIEAQDNDEVCKTIKQYCFENWLERHLLPSAIRSYWTDRTHLTVVQNILLEDTRIVIPSSMHLEVLDKIHDAHMEINKCHERAKQAVWWPELSSRFKTWLKTVRHA